MATEISDCFLEVPLIRAGFTRRKRLLAHACSRVGRASLFFLLAGCFTFAASAQGVTSSWTGRNGLPRNAPGLTSNRFAKPPAKAVHDLPTIVPPPFYRTWYFRTLIFLVGLGGIALAWKRSVSQLQRENARLHEFSRRLLESQERERKRMAVELHDSLGQHLLIIKSLADLGLRFMNDKKGAKEQFDEIAASATSAIAEVRQIAYNLRPIYLEKLGLTAGIEEMLEQVSSASGIQISGAIAPLDGSLSPDGTINLYRAIQESINNIVKHGNATRASVEVWREGGSIQVTVADNGCGFNPDGPVRRGLGLTSIAERVQMLGGTHTVISAPDHGVTLTMRFPEASGVPNAA
jgi:signal transduction histidine kinase